MAVGRRLWLCLVPAPREGNAAAAQLVGPLPATTGSRDRTYFNADWVPHLYVGAAPRNAQRLWRVGLRRDIARRRLHGARGDRGRSGEPHASPRPVARSGLVRRL